MATEFMGNKECARVLGVSRHTLRVWHAEDRGPPCFISQGKRWVRRYRRAEVAAWLNETRG